MCVCVCPDIVFLRSWYPVTIPQLYNPVTSLLLPAGEKDTWSGMRTLGQLKHDLGVRNKPNTDSLYKVGHDRAGLDHDPLVQWSYSNLWLFVLFLACGSIPETLQPSSHPQRAAEGSALQEQTQTPAGQRKDAQRPAEGDGDQRTSRQEGRKTR